MELRALREDSHQLTSVPKRSEPPYFFAFRLLRNSQHLLKSTNHTII